MSKRTELLMKENNELEKQMDEETAQVLTDIVVYIRSSDISPYCQEIVRRDIREMLLEGKRRGKGAKEVIGGDYRLFCDEVIAELPKMGKKEWFLSALRDTLLSAAVLMFIWFVFQIAGQIGSTDGGAYFTVTLGNVISAGGIILAAFFVFALISKNAFRSEAISNKKIFLILVGVLLLCSCANVFIPYSFFRIHACAAAAGIAALAVVYKILDRKVD